MVEEHSGSNPAPDLQMFTHVRAADPTVEVFHNACSTSLCVITCAALVECEVCYGAAPDCITWNSASSDVFYHICIYVDERRKKKMLL